MQRRLRILVCILYVARFRTFAFSHFAFYTYPHFHSVLDPPRSPAFSPDLAERIGLQRGLFKY